MVPRVIRLRRPVVLAVHGGRFVPERGAASLDEVDARWEALCAANPAYHDGACYHVLGVHRNGHGGASVHVMESSYRFQAVQHEQLDVGHRGLGVRGLMVHGGRALMGKRSQHVGRYPGLWEFAPAGGLPVGMEPAEALVDELREETGLERTGVSAVAVMFDDVARTWEIVFELAVQTSEVRCVSDEYEALEWFEVDALPGPMSHMTELMVPLLRE